MPSPGPKINSSLQQIMDISSRMGLFTPSENPSVQPMDGSGYNPVTISSVPSIKPSLNVQQQRSLDIYNMEQDQSKKEKLNKIMGYGVGALSLIDHLIPQEKPKSPVVRPLQSYNPSPYGTGSQAIARNGIHINPAHRGLFTSEATEHHMGVQQFASQVLSHKDHYSPSVVKRANFAKNFGGKKAEDGLTLDTEGAKPKPKKPYSFVNELKQLSSKKLDNSSSFQLAKKASSLTGINPSLLYSSAYVEGMNQNLVDPRPAQSDAYANAMQGYYTDFSGKKRLGTQNKIDNTAYPVDGYSAYGLDTFADRFNDFVKKGYLPASFKDQFTPYTASNEKETVHTAAFKNNEAALMAKAAYLRSTQDDVISYFRKKNQPIDPDAQNFFTMAMYNSPGSAPKMMDEYFSAKDKKAYLQQGQTKYKSVWNNIHQRMELMPIVSDYIDKNMKNGGKMKGYKCEDGGVIPYYPEGSTHDMDEQTIKELLSQGYQLDFQ